MAAAVRAAVQAHAPRRTVSAIARSVASASLFAMAARPEAGVGVVDGGKEKVKGKDNNTDNVTSMG